MFYIIGNIFRTKFNNRINEFNNISHIFFIFVVLFLKHSDKNISIKYKY